MDLPPIMMSFDFDLELTVFGRCCSLHTTSHARIAQLYTMSLESSSKYSGSSQSMSGSRALVDKAKELP